MGAPFKIVMLTVTMVLGTACAPPDTPYHHTRNGALVGATAGAVIGHHIDHRGGAVVGGVTGALVGSAIGSQMDYRDRQIEYAREDAQYEGEPYYDDDNTGFAPPPHRYRPLAPDEYGASSLYDDTGYPDGHGPDY